MSNEGVERGLSMKVIAKQVRESGLHPESSRETSSLETGKQHEQRGSLGIQNGKWFEWKQSCKQVWEEQLGDHY